MFWMNNLYQPEYGKSESSFLSSYDLSVFCAILLLNIIHFVPPLRLQGGSGAPDLVFKLVDGVLVGVAGDGQDDPGGGDGRQGAPALQVDPRRLLQVHAQGEGSLHREGHPPQGAGYLLRYASL